MFSIKLFVSPSFLSLRVLSVVLTGGGFVCLGFFASCFTLYSIDTLNGLSDVEENAVHAFVVLDATMLQNVFRSFY